jgi:signal peptidase I
MIRSAFFIAAIASRLMAFTPFIIDGPSMEPTLNSGDFIVLDSVAYKQAEPARGDVVVFSFEKEPLYFYVKRIVGLPGERVHVTSDGIYFEAADGAKKELLEPYLVHAQGEDPANGAENPAGGENAKNFALRGFKDQIFVVPSGKYLVLGDNRSHSLDSRSFIYPFIAKDRVKGKYVFTIKGL